MFKDVVSCLFIMTTMCRNYVLPKFYIIENFTKRVTNIFLIINFLIIYNIVMSDIIY